MTRLHLLPSRSAGAAENMALDFLLLQRYPEMALPRFRHYDWRGPAFTFGFSQKIAFVRASLPTDESVDLCRRPTGGGVVDHRNDWTYALVLPRGHALYDERAPQSYRIVHECLGASLLALGQPAAVKISCESAEPCDQSAAPAGPGVCFQRAELYDVVQTESGAKIAGAAQKRNKHGLLFQGSIWQPAVDGETTRPGVNWEIFGEEFATQLARSLGAEAVATPWPEFNEDETSALVEQYSTQEWTEFR